MAAQVAKTGLGVKWLSPFAGSIGPSETPHPLTILSPPDHWHKLGNLASRTTLCFTPPHLPLSCREFQKIIMITLKINGAEQQFDGDPDMPLLWYLRDVAGLTGSKYGCGTGLCGACTVHQDGVAIRSCITPVQRVVGKQITTIEGLSRGGDHPLQKVWAALNVPQCGYCQAGQIMQAAALLKKKPKPTDKDIDDAMSGNICRCGTYQRIRAAIKGAAKETA